MSLRRAAQALSQVGSAAGKGFAEGAFTQSRGMAGASPDEILTPMIPFLSAHLPLPGPLRAARGPSSLASPPKAGGPLRHPPAARTPGRRGDTRFFAPF